jgi:hypothetical protein
MEVVALSKFSSKKSLGAADLANLLPPHYIQRPVGPQAAPPG